MSFSDIAKLPEKEKKEVLGELKRSERSAYNDFELQAANQRIDSKTEVEQAANQRIDGKQEALNQSFLEKEKQVSSLVASAKQLMDDSGRQIIATELSKIQSSPDSSPIVAKLIEQ